MDLNSWMIIGAYFLGSLPFGLLIGLGVKGVDVRETGSGNIGASNVSRACGVGWGRLTLLLDALKGALPVAVALSISEEVAPAVGLAAILGHCFPVWLGFHGGKGVATTAGAVGVIAPQAMGVAVAIWWAGHRLTGISAVGSLAACVALIAALWGLEPEGLRLGVAAVALVVLRHRENIQRLWEGTENQSRF
ncbi:MAG: glycerol-3-phosphate 1-O-acyltransferase PlsY [Myxococcota bacterium]|nr:glycerol-3-phosphate 1-O-acyltransferase PlsY [Myxococcota bacterium]